MDKERARFILRSFRPDGADAEDLDFAEALQLATRDRELGEWLMRERAFDAEFAEALARVALPDGLRESILLAMVQNGREFPKVDLDEERKMMAAFAGIEVPEGLRERIIEAMEQTARSSETQVVWWKFGVPIAAAAGIALAFIFLRDPAGTQLTKGESRIRIEAVQAGFFRTYESPLFSLDKVGSESQHLISYLEEKGLPSGDDLIPPGLEGVRGLGCRELEIDGKKGSLICFDEKNGTLHLIIFRREDVSAELFGIENPVIEQSGDWAKARWEKGAYVCVLMGKRNSAELAALF